jgi:hypothetical protein
MKVGDSTTIIATSTLDRRLRRQTQHQRMSCDFASIYQALQFPMEIMI